jgi:hypothetical protein
VVAGRLTPEGAEARAGIADEKPASSRSRGRTARPHPGRAAEQPDLVAERVGQAECVQDLRAQLARDGAQRPDLGLEPVSVPEAQVRTMEFQPP